MMRGVIKRDSFVKSGGKGGNIGAGVIGLGPSSEIEDVLKLMSEYKESMLKMTYDDYLRGDLVKCITKNGESIRDWVTGSEYLWDSLIKEGGDLKLPLEEKVMISIGNNRIYHVIQGLTALVYSIESKSETINDAAKAARVKIIYDDFVDITLNTFDRIFGKSITLTGLTAAYWNRGSAATMDIISRYVNKNINLDDFFNDADKEIGVFVSNRSKLVVKKRVVGANNVNGNKYLGIDGGINKENYLGGFEGFSINYSKIGPSVLKDLLKRSNFIKKLNSFKDFCDKNIEFGNDSVMKMTNILFRAKRIVGKFNEQRETKAYFALGKLIWEEGHLRNKLDVSSLTSIDKVKFLKKFLGPIGYVAVKTYIDNEIEGEKGVKKMSQ